MRKIQILTCVLISLLLFSLNINATKINFKSRPLVKDKCIIKDKHSNLTRVIDRSNLSKSISDSSFVFNIYDVNGIATAPTNEVILMNLNADVNYVLDRIGVSDNVISIDSLSFYSTKIFKVSLNVGDVEFVVDKINEFDSKILASVNDITLNSFCSTSTDSIDISNQWYLDDTGVGMSAKKAWNYTKGAGIKVAVIDTGVNFEHPDLVSCFGGGIDVTDENILNGNASPYDPSSHGTYVAGVIAATANNFGIVGIAPEAKIYSIKVSTVNRGAAENTRYNTEKYKVIRGFVEAVNRYDVDVINFSAGGPEDATLSALIDSISLFGRNGRGCVIVAASGNSAPSNPNVGFPANKANVISVGSINKIGSRSSFSCYGNGLDVVAGGERIYTTKGTNSYSQENGTSFSAPLVSGLAALVLSVDSTLTSTKVKQYIQNNCKKLPNYPGVRNNEVGYGVVDAFSTLKNVENDRTVSIIGPTFLSEENDFSLANSDLANRVEWSVSNLSALPTIIKNTNDPNDYITLKDVYHYPGKFKLNAMVYVGNDTLKLSKYVYSGMGYTNKWRASIHQESCNYYNVTYPEFNKMTTGNGSTEYIYIGCEAEFRFFKEDVFGYEMEHISGTGTPEYWSYDPESCILRVSLPRYMGGVPFSFKFTPHPEMSCQSTKTVNLFTWTGNAQHSLRISEKNSTMEVVLCKNEDVMEQIPIFADYMTVELINIETGATVSKVVHNNYCTFDISSLPEGFYLVNAIVDGKVVREKTVIMKH